MGLCSSWLGLFRTKSVTHDRNSLQNDYFDVPQPTAENSDSLTPGARYQLEHLESSGTAAQTPRTRPSSSQTHPIPSGSRRASNTSVSQGSTIITPKPATVLAKDAVAAVLLGQAVADLDLIVHQTTDGTVLAGTLVGLVDHLISDFPDIRQNTEYRDQFLTTYCAFTTTERVYRLLVQKYREADTLPMESQAGRHFNIMLVMKRWVETPHVPVDIEIFKQLKNFTKSIANTRSMAELVDSIAEKIDKRIQAEKSIPSALNVDHVPIPDPANISPQDLAIALTVLEGERYNSLFAADYILHILRQSSSNKINSAINTNIKISTWVKMSILVPNDYDFRAEVFKFFINTALACRKLRNFSSIAAIVTALQSPAISRLMVTQRTSKKDALDSLSELVGDIPHYRSYKAALNKSNEPCVPWIDVHIHDLKVVLCKYPSVIEMNDRPLINFRRSIEVTNWIRKLRKYKVHCFSPDQSAGPLAYLQSQLREIDISPATDAALEARSLDFAEKEKKIHDRRVEEFKSIGMRTS